MDSKKCEMNDVSVKIKESKKELQELKAGLEELIKANIENTALKSKGPTRNEAANVETKEIKNDNEKKVEHQSRARIVSQTAQPILFRTNKSAIQKESKTKIDIDKECTAKKVRNYDKVEARDYIKRQKEKRYEEQKANLQERQNTIDLKKQKLKELHEKSKMLVEKNVTLKRERSKSREPASHVLPVKSGERFRSCSREKLHPSQFKARKEPQNHSQASSKTAQKIVKATNLPQKEQLYYKLQEGTQNEPNLKVTRKEVQPKMDVLKVPSHNTNASKEALTSPGSLSKHTNAEDTERSFKKIPPDSVKSLIQVFDELSDTTKVNNHGNSSIASSKSQENLNSKAVGKEKNKKPNNAITAVACEKLKLSKDTQTAGTGTVNNVPTWLQPNFTPDPFNFINTVKKKLQLVTNSPLPKVNSSCVPSGSKTPENNPKTKEEIMELIQKSIKDSKGFETKSFNSHKKLQLDFNSVDDLELPVMKSSSKKSALHLIGSDASESDTSKNIPDLSSESLSSLKKNALSVDKTSQFLDVPKLTLNSKNLDKLHLEKRNLDTFSVKNGDFSEANTASSRSAQSRKTAPNSKKSSSYTTDFELSDVGTELSAPKSQSSAVNRSKNSKHSKEFDIPQVNNSVHSNITVRTNSSIEDISQVSSTKSKHSKEENRNKAKSVSERIHKSTDQSIDSKDKSSHTSARISTSINTTSNSVSKKTKSKVEELQVPSVSLQIPRKNQNGNEITQNISIVRGDTQLQNPNNEIRLKFEAEVHLLNDFNESLRQFMAVEKAYENLKHKNDSNAVATKIVQNRDTQTSLITKSSSNNSVNHTITEDRHSSVNEIQSINYSRGSEIIEELDISDIKRNASHFVNSSVINNSTLNDISFLNNFDNSLMGSAFEFSNLNDTFNSTNNSQVIMSTSDIERVVQENNVAGFSMKMLEQLIRDEDARIENLTTIIKIREKALLDRTRSELACLEVYRKELIETGKLSKASAIKKKQRGIILKHQQERYEMQRLKQIQKAASKERKTILKQQSNQIKAQLSTSNMLSKMKVATPRRKRISGPMRVIQSQSESVVSETSVSRKNSSTTADEILSITSHSVVSRVFENIDHGSDFEDVSLSKINLDSTASNAQLANIKSTLLMRESALKKRRKTAEELLKWHQKLLEEEKKIQELESATKVVINQTPSNLSHNVQGKYYDFTGTQLNELWKNMTGREEQQFKEHKTFKMSHSELERFYKKAQDYSKQLKSSDNNNKSDKISEVSSVKSIPDIQSSISTNVQSDVQSINTQSDIQDETNVYTSDFDSDSVKEISGSVKTEKTAISSISELMENFTKIKEDISSLSKKSLPAISSIISQPPVNVSIKTNSKSFLSQETEENEALDTVNDVKSLSENDQKSFDTVEKISHQTNSLLENDAKESVIDLNEVNFLTEKSNSITDDTLKSVVDKIELISSEIKSSADSDVASQTSVSSVSEEKIIEATNLPESDDTAKSVIINNEPKLSSEEVSETSFGDVSSNLLSVDAKQAQDGSTEEEISELGMEEEIKESGTESKVDTIITPTNSESSKVSTLREIESNKSRAEITENELLENNKNALSNNSAITPLNSSNSFSDFRSSRKKPKKRGNLFETADFIDSKAPEAQISLDKSGETIVSNDSATISSGALTEEENKENISLNNLPVSSEKEVKSTETKEIDETEEDSISDVSDSVITTISTPQSKENKSSIKSNESAEKTINEEMLVSEVTENKTENLSDKSNKSETEDTLSEKSPKSEHMDVKKRVSEILADASPVSRGDKSPRIQDLYCTTYDLISPANSPELGSPEKRAVEKIFDNEAEELLRKQLAIEKEIKQLEQQQMKEQLPYLYIREIPDKPPPPYTPPASVQSSSPTLLPTSVEVIHDVSSYASNILYKAYKANNLANVRLTERNFKLVSKRQVSSQCCEFLFDFCKEAAINHYKQFEEEIGPTWLTVSKKQQFLTKKPFDAKGLERHLNKKLKELCGIQKTEIKESAIIKWSRKKHDHVDEVLVLESQAEESEWINYDKDELIVKDAVTNDIMNMLLSETVDIFKQILSRKT